MTDPHDSQNLFVMLLIAIVMGLLWPFTFAIYIYGSIQDKDDEDLGPVIRLIVTNFSTVGIYLLLYMGAAMVMGNWAAFYKAGWLYSKCALVGFVLVGAIALYVHYEAKIRDYRIRHRRNPLG